MANLCFESDIHDVEPVGSWGFSARISNPEAENGYDHDPSPLDWLNSARLTADVDEDSVTCVVSVGDPRGGFCFTVRRMPDGRMVIHVPHPGEGMAHMDTNWRHPGTLMVGHWRGDDFTPADFSSEPPEGEE